MINKPVNLKLIIMKTLKFHLIITILCLFSFLLLAVSVTFRKEFNVFKKEVEIRNNSAARPFNAEEFKNIRNLKR